MSALSQMYRGDAPDEQPRTESGHGLPHRLPYKPTTDSPPADD
jgi:hypothetical protein